MIKVLKDGCKTFKQTCSICGCEFTYDLSDLNSSYMVYCPCCNHLLAHSLEKTDKLTREFNIPFDKFVKKSDASPCSDCDWYKYVNTQGGTVVGDSPCEWCQNGNKIICDTESWK